jgi:hypothetical protein
VSNPIIALMRCQYCQISDSIIPMGIRTFIIMG